MSSPPVPDSALERRIVTVLFADLAGFTALSETLDPEDVATVQEAYFGAVRETVGRYGGRLEKFIGDAAMAVFGLPRARDDDAERAVRASLALTGAIERLGPQLGLDGASLRLRVGVNTGEVVVGGPDALATGDVVNVAARLQTAAEPDSVLVGETTALAVADAIELAGLDPIGLKGKAQLTRVWRALAVRPVRSRDHAMGRLHAPLLGRDAELTLLQDALESGIQRVVLVAPPGVGKTRLTDEFARDVDAAVLRARLRPDVVAPYRPVAQLVTAALVEAGIPLNEEVAHRAVRERVRASAARAGVVANALTAVVWPTRAAEDRGALAVDREALFDAWLDGFEALRGERRQLWLVEDVHWAGGDLLAFLERAGTAARLVLATARPSLLEQAATWCAERPGVRVHSLAPLSASDAGALVRALTGDVLPAPTVEAIADRSDGNALFIEELLRTWISVGILEAAEGGFRLAVDTAAEVSLPTTVQAIYAAQLDDLPAPARRVARHAAVAGRRFPDDALDPLDVPEPELGLSVLEQRAFVAAGPPDPLLGETHVYRHALLRDAGYASLARAERARLHVALARWLEQTSAERSSEVAEVIGGHYEAAVAAAPRLGRDVDVPGAARLAALWLERAAGTAIELAAHDAARALLRRALALTSEDALLERARRFELLGRATAFAADMEEGAEAMSAALDLYRTAGDPGSIARTGHALGMIRLQQLQFADALALADELLGEIGEEDASGALLLVLRASAAYALTNDLGRAGPDVDRALAFAVATMDERLELAARQWIVGFHSPDPTTLDAVDLGRAIELAYRKRRWEIVTTGHESRALLLVMTDCAAEATAVIELMEEVATAHGVTEALAWADYVRCEQGVVLGNWAAARDAGIRALDLADRNAYPRVAIRTWMALSPLAHAQRDVALLRRLHSWFEPRKARLPKSPFALLMFDAFELRMADVGLKVECHVDVEARIQGFGICFGSRRGSQARKPCSLRCSRCASSRRRQMRSAPSPSGTGVVVEDVARLRELAARAPARCVRRAV